jgi:hypothetical protein
MKTRVSGKMFVDTTAINSKTYSYKSKGYFIYVSVVVLEKAT